MRKSLLPSELVSIADKLEPLERMAALDCERSGKGADGSGGRGREKKPGAEHAHGFRKSRAKIAAAVGVSHFTLTRARRVVEAGRRDPKRFGALVTEMDRTDIVRDVRQGTRREGCGSFFVGDFTKADGRPRCDRVVGLHLQDVVRVGQSSAQCRLLQLRPP